MATNFPTSLDNFTAPQASEPMITHLAEHIDISDAIDALQAKVGIDSSANTDSLDYKISQRMTYEGAQDAAAALLTNGSHTNITATYDDANNRVDLYVSANAIYNDNNAKDAMDAALDAGTHSGISYSYNSTTRAISSTVDFSSVNTSIGNLSAVYINLTEKGSESGVAELDASGNLLIPGSTVDNYQVTVEVNPTANRTITVPDLSGTLTQDSFVKVYNAEAVTISKGEVVYLFSSYSGNVTVKKASNSQVSTSSRVLGFASENIASGSTGYVMTNGVLKGVNTSTYSIGDEIWLGSTGGTITGTKPTGSSTTIFLGKILQAHASTGEIFVRVPNAKSLEEINDISFTSLADKNVLVYNSSTSLWENKTDRADVNNYGRVYGLTQNSTDSANPNTALGFQALNGVGSNGDNIAIGSYALYATNTGNRNTAVGNSALYSIQSGNDNTAVGLGAIAVGTSSNSTALGSKALFSQTSGGDNTAVGKDSLYSVVTGSANVAIGYQAGYSETGSNRLHIANNSSESLITGHFTNKWVKVNGSILEKITTSATGAGSTINYDLKSNGSILYYTSNNTGNWTLNFRGDSSTTLNSILSVGDSLTIAFMTTNGATAYYPTAHQIDGNSITPKWQGGTAPTSGNASSIDSYTYTIIKTGNAAFTLLAAQTKFA